MKKEQANDLLAKAITEFEYEAGAATQQCATSEMATALGSTHIALSTALKKFKDIIVECAD